MRDLVWHGRVFADYNERCLKDCAEREHRATLVLGWAFSVSGSSAAVVLLHELGLLAGLPTLSKAVIGLLTVAIFAAWMQRLKDDPAKRAFEAHSAWARIHTGWRTAWSRCEGGEDVTKAISELHEKQAAIDSRSAGFKLPAKRQKAHLEAVKRANAYD